MRIPCGVCEKDFNMDKAIAVAWDPDNFELILICSEKCFKDYSDNIQRIFRIKIEKGGKK